MQAIRFFGLLMLISCTSLLGSWSIIDQAKKAVNFVFGRGNSSNNWSLEEFEERKNAILDSHKIKGVAIDRNGNNWFHSSGLVTCITPRGTIYQKTGDSPNLTVCGRDEKEKCMQALKQTLLGGVGDLDQILDRYSTEHMKPKSPVDEKQDQ